MSTETTSWRAKLKLGGWYLYTALVSLFLWLPIFAIIIASFYDGQLFAFPFKFSTRWYEQILVSSGARRALVTTLQMSVVVTAVATIFGTAAALGYTRYQFRGRGVFKILSLLPIFFPLILLGLGMQMWFSIVGFGTGIVPSIVGQIVWISPIVMFVVSIRALSIDPNIEEAARDLGAGTVTVYKDVVVPPIVDGIIPGAIFAFILSWNNYYIVANLSGARSSVTTWMQGQIQYSFAPLVPALAASIFYVTLIGVSVALFIWHWYSSTQA